MHKTITLDAAELRILIRALSAHELRLNERATHMQHVSDFEATLDEALDAAVLRMKVNGVAHD